MRALLVVGCVATFVAVLLASNSAACPGMDRARSAHALQDILTLSSSLELFKLDIGRYPSQQEGLAVLMQPTIDLVESGRYRPGGYAKVSRDPWGKDYQYRFPGIENPGGFDLWSFGSDGTAGGEHLAADLGNWPSASKGYADEIHSNELWQGLVAALAFSVFGFILGLPIYVAGYVRARRAGASPIGATKGFHLGALLYLMFVAAGTSLLFAPRLI